MSETPLEPIPVAEVLARQSAAFGRRGGKGPYLVALLVILVLATVAAVVIARGVGHPARLDRSAIAVADAFTKKAWDNHDCSAASHYLSSGQLCSLALIPAWQKFPLSSHQILRTGCHEPALPGQRPSPGCVAYTSTNGLVIRYRMTKTSHGWIINEIGTRGGQPTTTAPPLDQTALSVADTFTREAWNKHDCQAGSRYLVPDGSCDDAMIRSSFPLAGARLLRRGCGNSPWIGGYRISPGCVEYTLKKRGSTRTLEYGMSQTPHGWRILEIGTGQGYDSGIDEHSL